MKIVEMIISKIAHLPIEEAQLEINIIQTEEVNLIYKEMFQILVTIEEANRQSSITKELSIEIQL